MEMEDELFLEDDQDILDIINFGFPRRNYDRSEHFDTLDNLSFFRRFRLSKPTTLNILGLIEEDLQYENDLNNSLSPLNQILLALRIYASGGHQIAVGDFMGAHQSTVSRTLRRVTNAIARLRPLFINMPSTEQECLNVATDFYSIARFPRIIGCVDGTHIRMQSPGGEDAEVFRNRKAYFSINTQVVGDSNLKIQDIVARWPGSAHDQTIFNNSRICFRFENNEFPDKVLLGDSGYANRNYLLVPLQNPENIAQQYYNNSHIHTRNSIERLFGTWKRRFPILAYGSRYNPQVTCNIIVATAVLHNICIEQNEGVPPPLDLDINHLNYLIDNGNIHNAHQENDGGVILPNLFNLRGYLINNHFRNL